MRAMVVAAGALLVVLGCSGTQGDALGDDGGHDGPFGAGDPDSSTDAASDAGRDASPEADCPFQPPTAPVPHTQCQPVQDTRCDVASSCGAFRNHYICQPGVTPPVSLGCLSIGNEDFCCTQSACVLDMNTAPCSCATEKNNEMTEISCPPNLGPYLMDAGPFTGYPMGTYSGCGSNDAGTSFWCVQ